MRHHLHAFTLAVVLALLLVSCGDDAAGPVDGLADPGLSNVKTENGAARATAIPIEGGMITATGSNGAIYTLTIPADALDSSTKISLYPLTSITGYPLAENLKAGVHLAPEGFIPHVPLTLTMELPSAPDPRTLAAIASRRNAEGFHGFPAIIEGRKVTFEITHFSQYTVGNATLQALIDIDVARNGSAQYQDSLAVHYLAFNDDGTNPVAGYTQALTDWYNKVIVTKADTLESVTTISDMIDHGADLESDYNAWLAGISFARRTTSGVNVDGLMQDAKLRLARALRNKLDVINQDITRQAGTDPTGPNDLEVVRDIIATGGYAIETQALARRWGIDTRPHGLDLESVLDGLAVKAVIESRTLPSNFQPGSVGNLDIHAGISILGRPVRHEPAVTIRLPNFAPAAVSPTSGQTDAQGLFRSSVQWPSGTSSISIDIIALIPHRFVGVWQHSISVFDRITKNAGGQAEPLPTGAWAKSDHVWTFNGTSRQARGIRFEIYNDNDGLPRIRAFSPTIPTPTLLFDMPVTSTDGKSFTGSRSFPVEHNHPIEFFFHGFTMSVTGQILDNNFLRITWGGSGRGETVTGTDDIPPA